MCSPGAAIVSEVAQNARKIDITNVENLTNYLPEVNYMPRPRLTVLFAIEIFGAFCNVALAANPEQPSARITVPHRCKPGTACVIPGAPLPICLVTTSCWTLEKKAPSKTCPIGEPCSTTGRVVR